MPRTRGRPSKRGVSRGAPKKRGRGRPRKYIEDEEEIINEVIEDYDEQIEDQVMEAEARQSDKKRPRKSMQKIELEEEEEVVMEEAEQVIEKEVIINDESLATSLATLDEEQSCGLHITTMQIKALAQLVACRECGESVSLSVRPTTKGMISEFVVSCSVCEAKKVTITPNLVRERKRKREVKGLVLQKTENINYAHVAAFLDNGLGYSGLRHYCKYFNARCLNEATFIVYARQVIQDVVNDTEDNLQSNARIVRRTYDASLDEILDVTVSYTTTYHQWGSDFCLVAGAVIELQTGLVLDYDVANMYCHVCKINAKRIISMTPSEMTDWFNKHQNTCEIREWCDELDHDSDEGVKDIEPKYLECFVAKKIWSRSIEKFGFRYSTLIHESDETIHNELLRCAPYGDTLVMIDNLTNCFSRRKSEHARTAFQNKLKSKCPRERVQTKDRIMYVYAMSIPEYNRFAVGSNIKLRELVRKMELEETEGNEEGNYTLQVMNSNGEMVAIEEGDQIEMDGEVITGDPITTEGNEESIELEEEMGEEQVEEEEEPKAKKMKVEEEVSVEVGGGVSNAPPPSVTLIVSSVPLAATKKTVIITKTVTASSAEKTSTTPSADSVIMSTLPEETTQEKVVSSEPQGSNGVTQM